MHKLSDYLQLGAVIMLAMLLIGALSAKADQASQHHQNQFKIERK